MNECNLGDYDIIKWNDKIIKTNHFRELEGIEIITLHSHIMGFLKGFSCNILDKPIENYFLHGWYHIESKNAKFIVHEPRIIGLIISSAWKVFWNGEGKVQIYTIDCGHVYESHEYEKNVKYYYKLLLNNISNKIL